MLCRFGVLFKGDGEPLANLIGVGPRGMKDFCGVCKIFVFQFTG